MSGGPPDRTGRRVNPRWTRSGWGGQPPWMTGGDIEIQRVAKRLADYARPQGAVRLEDGLLPRPAPGPCHVARSRSGEAPLGTAGAVFPAQPMSPRMLPSISRMRSSLLRRS